MERLLVDARELAPMLSLSVWTVRHLEEQGMPHIRVGRRVLFDPIRVKEWLEQRGAQPPVADTRPEPTRRRTGRPRRLVP